MRKTTKDKTTQKTKENYEIPIPKRGDVFNIFKNAAKPEKESRPKRSPKKK